MLVKYNVLVRKEKQFGNFDFQGDIPIFSVVRRTMLRCLRFRVSFFPTLQDPCSNLIIWNAAL